MADEPMTTSVMKQVFGNGFEVHTEEVLRRWGDRGDSEELQRRARSYSVVDWATITAEGDQIQHRLAMLFEGCPAPGSTLAMDAVEAHRAHLTRWFFDVTPECHRSLGDLFTPDPRYMGPSGLAFDAPGFAAWVRDAIHANSDRHRS